MKRLLRWIAGIVGVAAGLLLVAALATLTWVDSTPWQDLAAFRETSARVAEFRGATNLVFGELRAGFGRAKLTPALEAGSSDAAGGRFGTVPLAGYGARRGQPATGVDQDLWVKAVAFAVGGRTGVVVSADALIVPREVAELASQRIRASRGLERGGVYFGATHTHSSLGGWGEGWVAEQFAGAFVPGVRDWFVQQLAGAVIAALDDLTPASAGGAGFAAPQFVRNRLLGDDAPEDAGFDLLVVKQADADRAVLGAYAAHATVLPASNLRFSGDYPGHWAAAVEQATGGMALFLAGGVGSHGPQAGAPGLEGARRMGEGLAALTTQALAGVVWTNQVAFGLASVEVPLPALQVRLGQQVRLRPWLAQRLLRTQPTVRLQGLRLGDAVWLSTPCDFSGELALELRTAGQVRERAVAVTSFNGDYVGYVIPAKHYRRDGYEPRTMSFYGPQLPEQFMLVLGELVAGLGGSVSQ